MRRDMNLIKEMLLFIENYQEMHEDSHQLEEMELPGYPLFDEGDSKTYWVVIYHYVLLSKSGLINTDSWETGKIDECGTKEIGHYILGLTWQGCEYIDAIRDKIFPAIYAKPQSIPPVEPQ